MSHPVVDLGLEALKLLQTAGAALLATTKAVCIETVKNPQGTGQQLAAILAEDTVTCCKSTCIGVRELTRKGMAKTSQVLDRFDNFVIEMLDRPGPTLQRQLAKVHDVLLKSDPFPDGGFAHTTFLLVDTIQTIAMMCAAKSGKSKTETVLAQRAAPPSAPARE